MYFPQYQRLKNEASRRRLLTDSEPCFAFHVVGLDEIIMTPQDPKKVRRLVRLVGEIDDAFTDDFLDLRATRLTLDRNADYVLWITALPTYSPDREERKLFREEFERDWIALRVYLNGYGNDA